MFASEYGWSVDYIKFELPMHEAARLIHAILYRRGVKTYRKRFDAIQADLSEQIKKARASFDATHELEGITF